MRKKGMAFNRKSDIREKNWAQLQHEDKVFNDHSCGGTPAGWIPK